MTAECHPRQLSALYVRSLLLYSCRELYYNYVVKTGYNPECPRMAMTTARQSACGREEHGGGGRGSLTARLPSSPIVPSPLRARGAPARQQTGSTLEQERVVQRLLAADADQKARQLPQADGSGSTPLQVSERQARWLGIPAGTKLQFRRRGNDSTRVCAAAAPVERTLHARAAPKRPQTAGTRRSSGMRARSYVDRCW